MPTGSRRSSPKTRTGRSTGAAPSARSSRTRAARSSRDFVADRFSTVLAGRQTQHYVTGTVFLELTEDFARTRSTVLVVHRILETGALVPVNAPVYMDEFVKTEAGWKISRHTAN